MQRFIFQSLQSEHPQCEARVVGYVGVEGARRTRREEAKHRQAGKTKQ